MANARLFGFWTGLTETLRTGEPRNEARTTGPAIFEEIYRDAGRLELYLNAMRGMGKLNFRTFAERFDFSQHRKVADIGGAMGQFSIDVARAHPHLECVTCDLAAVTPIAGRVVAEAGLSDRIRVTTCDMFKDPFPESDVVAMGMVLHNWGPEEQRFLIRKAFDALPANGVFVVIENIIDDDRRENVFGLMMSLNMLVTCGHAADFTGSDFSRWCREAGFREVEIMPLAGPASAGIAPQ
jgi:cyclopropane fatty-acyl-phospholipid synthase-like methyltransferase